MSGKKQIAISKDAARNYLLRYHHLTDDTALAHGDIEGFVRKVGCVQLISASVWPVSSNITAAAASSSTVA